MGRQLTSDDDVIRTVLSSNGEAIQYVNRELEYISLALSEAYGCALKLRCMIRYHDDEGNVPIMLQVLT